MTEISERDLDASDLARQVERIVGDGRVRAHYTGDQRLENVHDASRILSIAVLNSNLPRRPPLEVDAVYARVAEAGAAWLRQGGLLTAGTLVSIRCVREIDLVLVSWAWGAGGRAYCIGVDGRPTLQAPLEAAE